MDLGLVGFDGWGGSQTGFPNSSSDQETKHKWYGSGFHKQGRSAGPAAEEDWRTSKMAKDDDFSASKTMLYRSSNNATHHVSDAQQFLSFSNSPNSEAVLGGKTSQNPTLPYYHRPLSAYNRAAGQYSGSLNGAAMHWAAIAGARGPFTPSQWMELEHQALIYKYITANVPVPSNLLLPIKKAFDSAGFSVFPNGLLRPNSLGWGSIHLGFSNNSDPEPGRCRRTDGKKWRCWRDAVPDQKYCERHMNRGRHRSRKPVEGQTGHAVAGTATTTTSKQLTPSASSTLASSMSVPVGSGSSSLGIASQQLKSLQPAAASNSSAANQMNRMFVNKENAGDRMQQHTTGLSMSSKENSFLIQKPQMGAFEDSLRTEFGLVTSDALLNPSQNRPSLVSCRSFGASSPNLTESSETNPQQHSLRHFIDDWPKRQSDHPAPAVSWPDQLDMQSDRTQLSISIPVAASSDFIPSTSSTNNEKLTLSPLRLSREPDPAPMGLGVCSVINEQSSKQSNRIPITWDASLGGPLGEVLHHKNNNAAAECINSSVLNLMTWGWDNTNNNNSPSSLGSSPTGVLQKTAFVSLSNSSAGSSPRAEHRSHEGVSFCNDLLGSHMLNSSSMPAL